MDKEDYEPGTVRIFDKVLANGDYIIIAGAHQGYFATYCSRLVGKHGRVFAFEPEPFNNQALLKAVEGLSNVEVFPFALGDRNMDEVAFYINSDNDGGHALWDVSKHEANEKTRQDKIKIKIQIKTVDEVFSNRNMERLKLLMLDAEGAEHSILKGAINTIVDYGVPYVVCEINSTGMENCHTSQMELRSFMSIYGFSDYLVEDDKVLELPKNEIAKMGNNGENYIFNMLFSKRGKV